QRNCTVNYTTECIRIKKDKEETRVFTVDEEQKLVSYLTSHYDLTSLGILLCLFSGLRVGELSALNWDAFNFNTGTFDIIKTMQRVKADGISEKKTVVKIMEPKSKCSVRTIPIPENLKELLLSAKKEGAFLLTGSKDKYIEPRTLQNRFKKILKEANIENANFHTTRHTYATRCVEQEVETKCLAEMLGHSNVAITLNRYVHPSMELKTKEMTKLTNIFPITISISAEL
nr:site-specific integrase [Lachnospiraceae bacterium]